jgi:hypothetical protein
LQAKLEKQIQGQEVSMQEVRHLLESVIQEDLIKQLKRKIYDTIRDTISKDIKERVQREVLKKISNEGFVLLIRSSLLHKFLNDYGSKRHCIERVRQSKFRQAF